MLALRPGETVVDCTFGAGGHARRLAPRARRGGRYIAIDQDPEAGDWFADLADDVVCETRFIRANFADALPRLVDQGLRADAILMDLGLSSMQVDRPERGFSYSRQAPLDMRMDPSRRTRRRPGGRGARARAGRRHADLRRGALRPADRPGDRAPARAEPITTTGDLVEVVRSAVPTPALFAGGHPAKRVFQALRIAVNDELGSLDRGLDAAFDLLAPGGRLAVISFHSLEDRRVKRAMRARTQGCICPPDMPVCGCGREAEAALLAAQGQRPRQAELDRNPRARSALLRGLRRLEAPA